MQVIPVTQELKDSSNSIFHSYQYDQISSNFELIVVLFDKLFSYLHSLFLLYFALQKEEF